MAAFRAVRPLVGALAAPLPLVFDRRRAAQSEEAKAGLEKKWAELKCLKNEKHTHDTRKLTFKLPPGVSSWTEKVPITNVMVGAPFPGAEGEAPKMVARPYNPLAIDEPGTLTLLVKKYADAKVGGKLHSLEAGESFQIKGGFQQWTFEPHKYSRYGMVAGGTGITPLVQALSYILANDPFAKVTLLCTNKTPQDVLLADELSALQKTYSSRLTVVHHIDSLAGAQVDKAVLQRHMPAAAPGVLIMVCGPMGLTKAVAGPKAPDRTQGEVGGFLKEMGCSATHVWKV